MLITGPPNDSQETAIPHDIDIHGNSLGIDATRDISGDSASRHICLSRPCSPSSTHSHDDVTFRAVQSIHLHQYLETVHSYTPLPSSVSSHPEYCTMSCTDGDPAESTAETENSDDGDRMVDEGEWEYPIPSEGKCDSLLCRRMMLIGRSDIPLDTMEIIVRRAVLLLKLTPENSYAYQELSEYTCLLGEASSRVSPADPATPTASPTSTQAMLPLTMSRSTSSVRAPSAIRISIASSISPPKPACAIRCRTRTPTCAAT